jgi:integrase
MPKISVPLTSTQIDKAKPREKEYNLSDGYGLMMRIMPSGSKSWFFNYTNPQTHKRQVIVLGRYPVMTLGNAREERLKNQKLIAKGLDPKTVRNSILNDSKKAASNTFEVIALEWLVLHSTKVKGETSQSILKSLEKNVFPSIGTMPIDICTFSIIKNKVIVPIISRGSLEIARKVARRINQIMSYAVISELIQANPVTEVSKLIPSSKIRNLPALPPSELPSLLKAVHFADIKLQTRCMLEFQLHTMTRPGEASRATWQEIDVESKVWIIPPDKMKMAKEHRIPLTAEVLHLLEIMRPLSSHREYVFPSAINPKSHASKESVNRALVRMGFKGKTVAHGFRALASTTLNEASFDPDVIEAALAHKDPNKIRAAYNRSDYFEKRREMMSWWSKHIITNANISHSISGIQNI